MPIMENDLVHGCGRTFKYPAHYATHGLKCDGTNPETSSRIAGRGSSGSSTSTEGPKVEPRRTPRAAKRSSVRRKAKTRGKKREVALAVLVPEAKPVSPQDFLASLDVQIEKLLRVRAVVAEIA